MANWKALRQELSDDPLGIGYAVMADQDAADSLNQAINVEVTQVSSGEIFEAVVPAEYTALIDGDKKVVDLILGLGEVDASPGSQARTFLSGIFSGTQTLINLGALVAPTVTTRALQVFGAAVDVTIINTARTIT